MRFDTIQVAQEQLIDALDAGDPSEILVASERLSNQIDALRDLSSLYTDDATREALERVEKLSLAAAYRLRLLTDQTRRRLEMVGADQTALCYGPRAA